MFCNVKQELGSSKNDNEEMTLKAAADARLIFFFQSLASLLLQVAKFAKRFAKLLLNKIEKCGLQ